MFERIESNVMSISDAHRKWPDKVMLCYDVIHEPGWMSQFKVYALADNLDDCLKALPLFKLEHPDGVWSTAYTSPVENGRPLFND